MRQIPLSASLLTYLEELEFSEAALGADDDAKPLAAAFTGELGSWESVFKKERESRRNVIRAEAAVSVRNQQLDETTSRFGGVVMVEAKGDRTSTLFRRFFASAPSVFIRQGLRKQCERTRDTILTELGKVDDTSPLKAFVAPFKAGVELAFGALDGRAKAKADRGIVAHDIEEWKEGVNQLRTTTYAELLKIAVQQSHSKAWVNGFFRATDAGAEEETETEPPAP